MGRKNKILVVDDQVWVRRMLLEALSALGYEVFGASSGPEALQLAGERGPDLAIIDMSIPGMDGLTLFSKLRGINFNIHGILISGNGEKNCIEKALKEGAFAYLVKPFDIGDLKNLIQQALTS
ncbi:response regulator [Thermosediminibacter litoriperuensis]|uniref:Stage 0 sporulation protein A homolog n=1 Tax=Thermosediminibacter litoriperuensis TaxID=291989 RepID=A0A5S5AH27_9FIRM|nr:response regulator [Thermosediminibacter litoriperuensis]TYP49773.1 two-component system response regulator (stage 0 sporulation protein F) [Thermosediminibacter litoriperuensis]